MGTTHDHRSAHGHPFHHCPSCGATGLSFDGVHRFTCSACGFVFFHNTAAACGAILTYHDGVHGNRVLLLVRANDPAKGRLDFPGGFIDPGESAEAALTREIREEIEVEAEDLTYFCSAPNRYRYRNVVYNTCDLVFTGRITSRPQRLQEGEVAGYRLYSTEEVPIDDIAFPSLRGAMERYLATVRTGRDDRLVVNAAPTGEEASR